MFWKELVLALPRRLDFHCESARDPQTMLQEDKDPMLTLDPDYLDWRSEADPAGDLGTGTAKPRLEQLTIDCDLNVYLII